MKYIVIKEELELWILIACNLLKMLHIKKKIIDCTILPCEPWDTKDTQFTNEKFA